MDAVSRREFLLGLELEHEIGGGLPGVAAVDQPVRNEVDVFGIARLQMLGDFGGQVHDNGIKS